jgi:hypothetical protein
MLSMLGMAPCTNVRELVFGPDPEIREAFQQARKELVRYPSDLALIMLIEELAERGAPQAELDLASRVLVEVAGGVGFVLRNQRLRGCMEVALHWGM